MGKGERLDKNLFMFCDGPPGCVMLWIRDTGAGAVGVPCHVERLCEMLQGITYHVAAPGVECAFRRDVDKVAIELERPGGKRLSWFVDSEAFRGSLSRFAEATCEEGAYWG